jgi:hypothetical protein
MAFFTTVSNVRSGRVLAATLAGCVLSVAAIVPLRSEAPPANEAERHDSWVAYAEAALKLAEADVAEAEGQNRRVEDSVSEYDLERLRLHMRFAQETLSFIRQGGDYGELTARYADLYARLANLDVVTAEAARLIDPAAVSDDQYERMRRNAEVCRLQVALARYPDGGLFVVDHLHWETHRLTAEVMRLNRRLERLEEVALR